MTPVSSCCRAPLNCAMSDDALPSGASSHKPLSHDPLAPTNQANLRVAALRLHHSHLASGPALCAADFVWPHETSNSLRSPSAPPSARRATSNHQPLSFAFPLSALPFDRWACVCALCVCALCVSDLWIRPPISTFYRGDPYQRGLPIYFYTTNTHPQNTR